MMFLHHVFLAVLWVLYGGLHSLLASLRVKAWAQRKLGKRYRYYRLFYTLFAAVTLFALIGYQLFLPSRHLFSPSLFSTVAGICFLSTGLALMLVCIKKYFLSLSGLKTLYQEKPATELMISGIHRYMRHPLYSGTFLAIWGLWGLVPSASLLIANAVITIYTLLAIRLEEAKLLAAFGEPYRVYRQSVPMLIPRF